MIKLPQPNSRQRALAGNRAEGLENGVSMASYPIAGVVAYGLIGWLISHFIHAMWPIPVGMLIGLALSTGYVIYRYGTKAGSAHLDLDPRKENR